MLTILLQERLIMTNIFEVDLVWPSLLGVSRRLLGLRHARWLEGAQDLRVIADAGMLGWEY